MLSSWTLSKQTGLSHFSVGVRAQFSVTFRALSLPGRVPYSNLSALSPSFVSSQSDYMILSLGEPQHLVNLVLKLSLHKIFGLFQKQTFLSWINLSKWTNISRLNVINLNSDFKFHQIWILINWFYSYYKKTYWFLYNF